MAATAKVDTIKPGDMLYVSAGADVARNRPYYCRVTEHYSTDGNGWYHLRVQPVRADGSIGTRCGKARPTQYAILDPAKVRAA